MKHALLCALLTAGCTLDSQLLAPVPDLASAVDGGSDGPPARSFAFCPTSIDVFGGANVQLVGCGGRGMPPAPLESGYFNPGSADYDATLAGRLQARLAADPDLSPRFGTTWQVRDCALSGGQLASLVPPVPADLCGQTDSPGAMGALASVCTTRPAPLLVLVADEVDDRCHGGGPPSGHPDDQATYAQHFSGRLDAFLANRAPSLLMTGVATEWRAAERPPQMGGPPMYDAASCTWKRADWDGQAMGAWLATHPGATNIVAFGDLHDEFKHHHPCCQTLGVGCATNWFGAPPMGAPMGPDVVNCDGAQAIIEFWYTRLKQFLLANTFQCP